MMPAMWPLEASTNRTSPPNDAQRPRDLGPVDWDDLTQGIRIPHLIDGAERRVLLQDLFELLHPAGKRVGCWRIGGHLPPWLTPASRGLTGRGHLIHPGRPHPKHHIRSRDVFARSHLTLVDVLSHGFPP